MKTTIVTLTICAALAVPHTAYANCSESGGANERAIEAVKAKGNGAAASAALVAAQLQILANICSTEQVSVEELSLLRTDIDLLVATLTDEVNAQNDESSNKSCSHSTNMGRIGALKNAGESAVGAVEGQVSLIARFVQVITRGCTFRPRSEPAQGSN